MPSSAPAGPLIQSNSARSPNYVSYTHLDVYKRQLCLWGWRAVAETDWAALPPIVWICLIYVSVAASAMTFVLLQYAALRLPAAKVMAYTYLVPSWVILWEIALHHGAPPAVVLVGVALTVLALALLLKSEPETPKTSSRGDHVRQSQTPRP